MSWQDEAVATLRILVGDFDTTETYCDETLIKLFVGAAKMVSNEASFDVTYTISASNQTISPDPSDDSSFITLSALKAAYIIANSEYRVKSLSAVSITDGPSSINLTNVVTGLKARVDRLAKDYSDALFDYALGSTVGIACISTPTTVDGYNYYYQLHSQTR